MSVFTGTPGRWEQKSILGKEQMPLYNQLQGAATGQRGAGGAYGQAADYYSDLLSDDSNTAQMMQAPEMRRFHQETIPGLAEQYAGYGSGSLSSSGFRNAAVGAGADLSERLGALRAQLRQQGAQGLQNIGQQGLQQYNQNVYTKGQPGLIDAAGPALGAAGAAFGGPAGGALGAMAGNWFSSQYGQNNNGGANSLGGRTVLNSGNYNFGGTR